MVGRREVLAAMGSGRSGLGALSVTWVHDEATVVVVVGDNMIDGMSPW